MQQLEIGCNMQQLMKLQSQHTAITKNCGCNSQQLTLGAALRKYAVVFATCNNYSLEIFNNWGKTPIFATIEENPATISPSEDFTTRPFFVKVSPRKTLPELMCPFYTGSL